MPPHRISKTLSVFHDPTQTPWETAHTIDYRHFFKILTISAHSNICHAVKRSVTTKRYSKAKASMISQCVATQLCSISKIICQQGSLSNANRLKRNKIAIGQRPKTPDSTDTGAKFSENNNKNNNIFTLPKLCYISGYYNYLLCVFYNIEDSIEEDRWRAPRQT